MQLRHEMMSCDAGNSWIGSRLSELKLLIVTGYPYELFNNSRHVCSTCANVSFTNYSGQLGPCLHSYGETPRLGHSLLRQLQSFGSDFNGAMRAFAATTLPHRNCVESQ
jgi:hypothetical protein